MTIIEQIKAEVENALHILGSGYSEMEMGQISAYGHILSFLSTLESEKPVPNDLEEAAWDCVLDSVDVNNPVLLPKYKELLTYLFIAGAKWQKQHDAKLIEIAYNDGITIGMTKQKEQMMKEAVEGHIVSRNDGWNSIELPSTFFGELSKKYKDGDKVHIIIVKEEN